jgi:ubiquitin carboxyl-terminal hydrolase 8
MSLYPRGIHNAGNTCYFNTIIQCITSCPSIVEFLSVNASEVKDPIVREIIAFSDAKCTGGGVHDPRPLLQSFHNVFHMMMYIMEQNDANETYMLLMDHLMRVCGRQIIDIDTVNNTDPLLKQKADKQWAQHHKTEYSKLCHIVCGQHISQIACSTCRVLHHNYEVITNMMLTLPNCGANVCIKLHDLIDAYFNDEVVDDWTCDKCNTKKNGSVKSIRQWRNPEVLVLTIKRFTHDGKKITNPIDVPQTVDMSQYTISRSTNVLYSLCAAAIHHGSYAGGHYVSIIKHNEFWFEVDDQVARRFVQEDHMKHALQDGYMFFYHKISQT